MKYAEGNTVIMKPRKWFKENWTYNNGTYYYETYWLREEELDYCGKVLMIVISNMDYYLCDADIRLELPECAVNSPAKQSIIEILRSNYNEF